jgi:hypothetical protein
MYFDEQSKEENSTMPDEPSRNFGADARYVESGGLKNGGCFAVGLFVLILLIFYVVVHVLVIHVWGDPTAVLVSAGIAIAVAVGAISLWIRRRSRLRSAQEQLWQEQMEKNR